MKPRVCLLTAYNSAQQPLAVLTAPGMRAFAEAHGYAVRAEYRDDWERPRGWTKVEAIRAALEDDFDFVLWIDVDAVVVRRDVDIRSAAIDGACLHMAWHGPDTSKIEAANFVPHFNSGVMLIRVGDWSRSFFKRVWDVGQLPHQWSDQATILHVLGYDECLGLGANRPDEPARSRLARLDTIWNSAPGLAVAPDAIIHHYAGISNPSTRLKLIEADVRTAPLREGASPSLRQAFADQLSLWREDATMRDWVTAERDAALSEREAARSVIAALRRSTSWKITAPLRAVSEILQRLRGRADPSG
jgi:hypothetical protein